MAYIPIPTQQQSTSTSNATPANLDFAVTGGVFRVYIQAASGNDRKTWELATGVKVISGTATVLGSVVNVLNGVGDLSLTTALASVSANGGNIRVTLTGIAATNIDWVVKLVKWI